MIRKDNVEVFKKGTFARVPFHCFFCIQSKKTDKWMEKNYAYEFFFSYSDIRHIH